MTDTGVTMHTINIYSVNNLTKIILDFEEGYSEVVHRNSAGYPTIGRGLKIGKAGTPLSNYKLLRMPEDIADMYLTEVVQCKLLKILSNYGLREAYEVCNAPRRAVLLSMAYEMGTKKLDKFKKTIEYILSDEWSEASIEMLDSVWARDESPERAMRYSTIMNTGIIESVAEYTDVL